MDNVSTTITPPWPSPPYRLACPASTLQGDCDRLGPASVATNCAEPEVDTAEVLGSLLVGCARHGASCVYVDVGCNIGAFALQAAALGAHVECLEPAPFFARAIRASIGLNSGFDQLTNVSHAAVVRSHPPSRQLTLHDTFKPCGVGGAAEQKELHRGHGAWTAPTRTLSSILRGRHVHLLKIDIDSREGELLSEVLHLLQHDRTRVDAILVELGDPSRRLQACSTLETLAVDPTFARYNRMCHRSTAGVARPRFGNATDLYTLQTMGYTVYRINIHVNREIFDLKGRNVNTRMSSQQPHFEPLHAVRAIRKLERLRDDTPLSAYPDLLWWAQSVLITARPLTAAKTAHHEVDVGFAQIRSEALNADIHAP